MKQDNKLYIFYGEIILAAIIIFYVISSSSETKQVIEPEENISEAFTFKTISSGSTDQDDVLIELTPRAATQGILTVDISANTHSVDLSQFDLKEITTLEFGGKIINPSSAPPLNGHHSSGALTFNVANELGRFTITITGIPNVEERIFAWESV